MYNLEVDADHCYRVGEQGILVHNGSFVAPNCDPCAGSITPTHNPPENVPGTGGTYRASVQRGSYRGGQPICRVNSIEGPIQLLPDHVRGPGNAQKRMRTFFFSGNGTEQKQAKGQHDAGHLIADSFGGPDDERNLVPMVQGLNRLGDRAWYVMEGYIRECLRSGWIGAEGWMKVNLTYGNPVFYYRCIPTKFEGVFRLSGRCGTKLYPFTFENQSGVLTSDFGPYSAPGTITGPANPLPTIYPFAPGSRSQLPLHASLRGCNERRRVDSTLGTSPQGHLHHGWL